MRQKQVPGQAWTTSNHQPRDDRASDKAHVSQMQAKAEHCGCSEASGGLLTSIRFARIWRKQDVHAPLCGQSKQGWRTWNRSRAGRGSQGTSSDEISLRKNSLGHLDSSCPPVLLRHRVRGSVIWSLSYSHSVTKTAHLTLQAGEAIWPGHPTACAALCTLDEHVTGPVKLSS